LQGKDFESYFGHGSDGTKLVEIRPTFFA
jgi:hypothetical protein